MKKGASISVLARKFATTRQTIMRGRSLLSASDRGGRLGRSRKGGLSPFLSPAERAGSANSSQS
ncbi:hypothetical protein [Mesorhizobium mediterraneum]|uniref:hypothetical protein n=1 Tax=Mesorhizobium TaxID=68287 RepID=UPI003D802082